MFYNKNGIIVDESRYSVLGETFPINAIASVSAVKYYPFSVLGIIAGAGIFLGFGLRSLDRSLEGIGLGMLIFSVLLLIPAFKTKYAVRITNAAGNADSYKSSDQEEVSEIVGAINEAIIHRG